MKLNFNLQLQKLNLHDLERKAQRAVRNASVWS